MVSAVFTWITEAWAVCREFGAAYGLHYCLFWGSAMITIISVGTYFR